MKKTSRFVALLTVLSMLLVMGCQSIQPEGSGIPVPEPTTGTGAPAAELFSAGTYQASAQGKNGLVTVEVVFSSNRIESVTVGEHAETAGIADTPIERIPKSIVDKQSLMVDMVSGATNTSNAILTAVEDCVKQAGGNVEALRNMQKTQAGQAQTLETGVLVIGTGFAGLSAANAAVEVGAQVLVIEKQAIIGGTSALSGGETYSDGDVAKKEGMYTYWVDRNKEFDDYDKMNTGKVRTFIDELYPTLDWLSEKFGIQYSEDLKSNPVRRPYGGDDRGAGFVKRLYDGLIAQGVSVMLETKATKLLQDANGTVIGAEAVATDGGILTIQASKVILATGGFSQNAELMERYAQDYASFPTTAAAGATGDGMLMAEEVGAALFPDSAAVNNYAVTAANGDSLNGLVKSSGLFVGQDGSRRSAENEDRYYISTKYLHLDEGSDFYTVYDAKAVTQLEIAELFEQHIGEADVYKADTLEELALQMSIDPAALLATVARYNELCGKGLDEDLGKPESLLLPIETEPFYAAKNHQVVYTVLGGIKTNNSAQALDMQGNVIPGLYAAGDISARDMYGDLYIGASAVPQALVMGRIAGRHAVEN